MRIAGDGASLPKLFSLCDLSPQAAVDRKLLLDQVLFNLCIDNHDAHGKNFTFYVHNKGLRLTPAYDLVNIAMYPELDQDMAMALGDEFDSRTVNAYQLADFAESCCLPRALVARRLIVIAQRIMQHLPVVLSAYAARDESEKAFVAHLEKTVRERSEHLLVEAAGIQSIGL